MATDTWTPEERVAEWYAEIPRGPAFGPFFTMQEAYVEAKRLMQRVRGDTAVAIKRYRELVELSEVAVPRK